tara:strand:- start:260 stop:364 length:105 start_codon:yes stop_codon:yes gene_type:complete
MIKKLHAARVEAGVNLDSEKITVMSEDCMVNFSG